MKSRIAFGLAWLLVLLPLVLIGCGGGGGGGGGGSTSGGTPVSTDVLIIQVRDPQSARVDAVVTVSSLVVATQNGDATYTGLIARGNRTVSVEVNGQTTRQTVNVMAGTTVATIVIDPNVVVIPSGTVPATPKF